MKTIEGFKYIIVECRELFEVANMRKEGGYEKERTDPTTGFVYFYFEK